MAKPAREPYSPDWGTLDDLITFARVEVAAADIEPWAAVLADLYSSGVVDLEGALWLVKLYNAYDSLGSAWQVFRRWPSPHEWAVAGDATDAARYPCTNERRNLRAGKVLHHLESYVAHLAGATQWEWINAAIVGGSDPRTHWPTLIWWTRRVWGVGRQTAFEWVEFLHKVAGVDCPAPDAFLWESEGPRRSLQRLYGNPNPSSAWLDARAVECRAMLRDAGISLAWEDFETVICDFNVMRDGRYYPGRHLAAIREEIAELGDDAALVAASFDRVVPEPWSLITPGIRKDLRPVYRDSGVIIAEPHLSLADAAEPA